MLVNYNGSLINDSESSSSIYHLIINNHFQIRQGFIIINNKILMLESGYFNLMASMRKMRIKIPMHYTLEFFEENILLLTNQLGEKNFSVLYTIYVENNSAKFVLNAIERDHNLVIKNKNLNLDVFHDYSIFPTLLSEIFINHPENHIAKRFAYENDLDEILFLNHEKKVARAISGNIYFLENEIWTTNIPKNGAYLQSIDYELQQYMKKEKIPLKIDTFSAFDLQKAKEVFILGEGIGLQSIKQFRKKTYDLNETQIIGNRFLESLINT